MELKDYTLKEMTQEDKLKDLCARLNSGVKVTTTNPAVKLGTISGISIKGKITVSTEHADIVFDCTEVKPYLRPMSSMTGAEMLEYISLKEDIIACDDITYSFETYKSIDWLNAHYFDHRGLIPNGFALEAPEGMYN